MPGMRRMQMWMRALLFKRAVEAERDEEMRFHLELAAAHHARHGLSPADARRRAALAFGSMEQHKERMREGLGVRGLERAAADLRLAGRQLRRTPGFAAAAVLTLALGIGGNAAVFSVVDGVLLRPLAFPSADRLVTIAHRTRGGDMPSELPDAEATHIVYTEGSRSFDAMALYSTWQGSLLGAGGPPEWVDAVTATRSLFDVLQVPPALGRTFTADEDRPGGPRAVVLSHAFWRQRFGGDPGIIGRMVTLDGVDREIVGVMPAGFAFPTARTDLWVPMRIDRSDLGGFHTPGIGRLKPGVTPEAAAAELAQLLPRVTALVDFLQPATLRDSGVRPDVHPYLDDVVGGVRPALVTLWIMVGLVLVIAAVNVASLLLVRAEARRREVAVRMALGAARGHLLAQSLAESAALLTLGSVVGLGLAWAAITMLVHLAPDLVPRVDAVHVDLRVIAVTTLVSAVVALAFGILPVTRRAVAPTSVLRGGDRASTRDRRSGRLRQILVAGQVAMATVLLVTSGLVLRSYANLRAVDPGFRPDSVITFRIALPRARYATADAVARFHYAMLDRIRAMPGVHAAGATGTLPLAGTFREIDPLQVEGRAMPPNTLPPLAEMRVATPGYFEAMGIPLLAGRTLERSDTETRSGAVVVSSAVARKVMDDRDPIGARVAHGLPGVPGQREWSDVVGVVGDVSGETLERAPMGAVYYAMVNRPKVGMEWLAESMVYVVKSGAPPATLIDAVRRELARLDPAIPLAETRTLSSVLDGARAPRRFSVIGFAAAALVGLFMGAIGLYGVLSYVTAQRTREIGVRMALGATPARVRSGVLRHGLLVSATGVVIGLGGAVAVRGLASPLLYGVQAGDPVTFAVVTVVLLLVGGLATWLPARRAARLDPVRAIHAES